ncbi:MAG: type II toxin-antitoxin system VapC family toxin [Promethearchaeota archaeon]
MWILDTNALIICMKDENKNIFKKNYSFTTIFSLIEYPIAINQKFLVIFYPKHNTYQKSLEYTAKLRKNGTPIPAIDILIGAIAIEKKMIIVSNDAHFNFFKEVEAQLRIIDTNEYIQEILKIKIF